MVMLQMSRQLVFILRRILLTVPMLIVMSIVVFLIIRLVPGDPVRTMLGFRATDENVATLRTQLGLDQPLLDQYLTWAGALLRGDLGQSPGGWPEKLQKKALKGDTPITQPATSTTGW